MSSKCMSEDSFFFYIVDTLQFILDLVFLFFLNSINIYGLYFSFLNIVKNLIELAHTIYVVVTYSKYFVNICVIFFFFIEFVF